MDTGAGTANFSSVERKEVSKSVLPLRFLFLDGAFVTEDVAETEVITEDGLDGTGDGVDGTGDGVDGTEASSEMVETEFGTKVLRLTLKRRINNLVC